MRRAIPAIAGAMLALSPVAPAIAQDAVPPSESPPPAGTYRLDTLHASIIVHVNHMGFSRYPVRFTEFDIQMEFDPQAPETMSVTAEIDPASLETHYPLDDVDFDAELTGAQWLDVENHPVIRFVSSDVTLTGENTAQVAGTLTLMGIEQPLTLDVTYNGGYAGMPPYDPQARIGFSATAAFDRSAFGLVYGIPEEGSNIGVADAVTVNIEAELLGPPLEAAD